MKPLLLLIPGMLNTADLWTDVVASLNVDAEVRICDVQTQSSIADMARDAWAMVSDVASDRLLVVVGFSMGGYVAMEMLAQPARRVDAVALLDTSGRPDSDAARAHRLAAAATMTEDFARVTTQIAANGTHPSTQRQAASMNRLLAMFTAAGPQAGARQLRAISGRVDHRSTLARLDLPAMVVCGREDRITPPDRSEELASLIPGAQLDMIEQAGHMTPLERPHRVAQLLSGLLQRATAHRAERVT